MQNKKKSGLSSTCFVCSGPSASHLHYGAVSCYSCRAFFRRGIRRSYCCVEGTGDCSIDWTSRRSCQWCRFQKCLRMGMNPELVDASLKKKSLRKKSVADEVPVLIVNLEPLENTGVVSSVLKGILSETGSESDSNVYTFVENIGQEKIHPVQNEILSEQELSHQNFTCSPTTSFMSDTVISPTTSDCYSNYSEDRLGAPCEYFDMANIGANLCESVPESTGQISGWEDDPFFQFLHQNPVIVKNPQSHANVNESSVFDDQFDELNFLTNTEFTLLSNSITTGSQKENSEPIRNLDDFYLESDKKENSEDNEMKSSFDIESLVEECFRQFGKI